MEEIYFYIIVAIIVLDFIFEQYLDYINTQTRTCDIPQQVKGIYNIHKYRKSQLYKKANYIFGIYSSSFSFLLILLMLFLSGFAYIDTIVTGISNNILLQTVLYFAIIGFAADILNTPFEVYDTFVLEQRFGFNKTSPGLFIIDKIKGWLISALVGGGLLLLIVWLWSVTGKWFWIVAWGAITFFSVFFSMFYSSIIVPLFNKQTPLADGELKQAIEKFAYKVGFSLKNIYVIDGSKRSSKANAYFTGLGSKKRIVLYDTLIDEMTVDEIVAVLAHEMGHYKKKHIISGLVAGIAQTGLMLFVFSLFVSSPYLSGALGVDEPKFYVGLVAFTILYSPLSFFLGIAMNVLSRKNEYQADAFAAQHGLGKELSSALKKLAMNNLSNLTPHPLYVYFNYSHPPLAQRLSKIEEMTA
jgi:STE24 endopeptidase